MLAWQSVAGDDVLSSWKFPCVCPPPCAPCFQRIEDYWGPAKKTIMDANAFLTNLRGYDKDNIDPKIMKVIRDK